MSRRRKPPSIPAPPEIAESAKAYEQFLAKLFPEGLKPERAQSNSTLLKYLARRDLGLSPPLKRGKLAQDGPQVRFAKELMQKRFRRDEWRTMGPRAVRHACERLAQKQEKRLPGVDSFARAMGRRK
jgi:hypothetical protein